MNKDIGTHAVFNSPWHIILILFLFPCFLIISWQIPKSVQYKKENGKEDGHIVEEKKDNRWIDEKVPNLEVKVDSKEEEEELLSHTIVTWDQTRR